MSLLLQGGTKLSLLLLNFYKMYSRGVILWSIFFENSPECSNFVAKIVGCEDIGGSLSTVLIENRYSNYLNPN
jgi:hypothetical protein